MWQALVPLGLAGIDMIMQKERGDKASRFAKAELARSKGQAKRDAMVNMYMQYAAQNGMPTAGLAAQAKAKAIDEYQPPQQEQGVDYSRLLGALAQAGTTVGAELSKDGEGFDIPDGVTDEDADYAELLERERTGRSRLRIGNLGEF